MPVHSGGPYNVVEQAPPTNWALVTGNPCNGTVPTDGNLLCDFTNKYTPPLAFSTHGGFDYIKIDVPNLNWDAARTAAQGLGSGGWDLATINSQEEQEFINTLLPTLPLPGIVQYWVGGYQQSGAPEPAGGWFWIGQEDPFTNAPYETGLYSNWGPGEPNNNFNSATQPQNHLALDNRYGWGWDDNETLAYPVLAGYVASRVHTP